jgi:hypothetical protein
VDIRPHILVPEPFVKEDDWVQIVEERRFSLATGLTSTTVLLRSFCRRVRVTNGTAVACSFPFRPPYLVSFSFPSSAGKPARTRYAFNTLFYIVSYTTHVIASGPTSAFKRMRPRWGARRIRPEHSRAMTRKRMCTGQSLLRPLKGLRDRRTRLRSGFVSIKMKRKHD